MFGISCERKRPISDCGAVSDERARESARPAPFLQRFHFHGIDAGKGFSALLSVDWDSADVVNGVV